MDLDLSQHPVSILQSFFKKIVRLHSQAEAEFSYYSYSPQTIVDQRELFKVPLASITPLWLKEVLTKIPSGVELAFHSRIWVDELPYHIPMADFSVSHRAKRLLPNLIIVGSLKLKPIWFDSGRSYHVYSSLLLNDDELVGYFAELLTLPKSEKLVDVRWVGHRLMAGYASLRWSCNTKQYLKIPEKL